MTAEVDSVKRNAINREFGRRSDLARSNQAAARVVSRVDDVLGMIRDMANTCKVSRPRVSNLLKKYPKWSDPDVAAVACRSVRIGMTAEQAEAAWGRPDDINRTTTASEFTNSGCIPTPMAFHTPICTSRTVKSRRYRTRMAEVGSGSHRLPESLAGTVPSAR